jgi:hypothetical protein
MIIADTCTGSIIASGELAQEASRKHQEETAIAAENISALRPVWLDTVGWRVASAVYAEAEACIGISQAAAATGQSLTVSTSGDMEDASWSWTPGQRIYLTDTGTLSHTPGSTIKEMAFALTPTKIIVEPREAIEFA